MAELQALLLDADGVVQLPAAAWRASLENLCADPARIEAFVEDVFDAERPCLTGQGDFRGSLQEVLGRWRSVSSVDEALRVWTLIQPDADVLGLVSRVRAAGLAVALATNQQPYRARFMTEELGYAGRFDRLLYSCELGHAKPSAGYFEAALGKLGTVPDRVLFIDDHAGNVDAARRCGLRAETFHLSEGIDRLREVLVSHGIRGA